mgnify:CR=1 FL=1
MMLQKIEKLVIEDCRIWKGRHEFDFESGVNVIHGDNGAGKSTLAMMLMLTMTHGANSSVLKKQLLPTAGGSPKSSVTFTTQDGHFAIRKVWGDRDQSQLVDVGNGDVIASGGEAEDMVRELAFKMPPADGKYSTNAGPVGNLTKKIERYLPSLSFHQQGDLHVVPDMGEDLQRIGLTFDDAEMSKALLGIAKGAEIERANLIKVLNKDGSPKKGTSGSIVSKMAELDEKRQKLTEAKELETQLEKAEEDLYEHQTRGEQDISEENQQVTREEIRNLRLTAEAHRVERDEAGENTEKLRLIHEPLHKILQERKDLIAKLEELEGNEKKRSDEILRLKEVYDNAVVAFDNAESKNKAAKEEFDVAMAWNAYLTREQTLSQDNEVLKTAQENLKTLIKSKAKRAKIEKKLGKIKLPSKEQWITIRGFDEQIAVAKASRKMEVKIHDKSIGLDVTGDGEIVEKSGEASERIEVHKGKKLLIEVKQAMSGKSPSELEEEKKQFVNGLGAESTSELQQWQLDANSYETGISNLTAIIDALPDEADLNDKIVTYQLRAEEKAEKPKGVQPKGELSEEIIRLEERRKISNENFENKTTAKTDALVKLKAAETVHIDTTALRLEKSAELDEHRITYGSEEDIIDKEDVAKQEYVAAQKTHNALRDNKQLKEDTPLERARLLQKNLDNYDERRANVLQLSERVKQLRNNSLLQELPKYESEIIQMENELQELQFDHDAYQHIVRIATLEQINSQAQSRNKISEEIDRLLQHVWGGTVEIELDEEGKPVQTRGIAVDDESHGSREQLQTILRMVLLGEASNHEGTALLLDDALVFADQGRLSRMKDVIRESVRKDSMQILVFSCRGADYTDIADKVYNLNNI